MMNKTGGSFVLLYHQKEFSPSILTSMNTLRISAISYLNTIPFLHGIRNSGDLSDYLLEYDVPSVCAEKLASGKTDIGIVPVAAIPSIPGAQIITDYCIGASGKVRTVLLVAHQPLSAIRKIYLDPDSRTSVQLTRILARKFWKQSFDFLPMKQDKPFDIDPDEALVLIGDKTFRLAQKYPVQLDLSEEWKSFTGLPFVFACWVSNRELGPTLRKNFEKAIEFGITHRPDAIRQLIDDQSYPGVDVQDYLLNTISYELDSDKRKALHLFLNLLKDQD